MFKTFYPERYAASAYGIPYAQMKKKGIKGVIFDVDNTLVPHGEPADERAVNLFSHLRELGLDTCLMSNNKEPRVASFAVQVDSKYLFKCQKPGAGGYRKAMELMGTDRKTTLFVGDQLFTDIWGAKRLGLHNVLVKPIHPKEEIQIVIKRYLEKLVLFFYGREKKKGGRPLLDWEDKP